MELKVLLSCSWGCWVFFVVICSCTNYRRLLESILIILQWPDYNSGVYYFRQIILQIFHCFTLTVSIPNVFIEFLRMLVVHLVCNFWYFEISIFMLNWILLGSMVCLIVLVLWDFSWFNLFLYSIDEIIFYNIHICIKI